MHMPEAFSLCSVYLPHCKVSTERSIWTLTRYRGIYLEFWLICFRLIYLWKFCYWFVSKLGWALVWYQWPFAQSVHRIGQPFNHFPTWLPLCSSSFLSARLTDCLPFFFLLPFLYSYLLTYQIISLPSSNSPPVCLSLHRCMTACFLYVCMPT